MDERLTALSHWAEEQLGQRDIEIVPASEDASFRRYFRILNREESYIVMDAPPQREDTRPFVRAARRLLALGLNVPEILAQEPEQGFLLLSDLGIRTYLSALGPDTVEWLYGDALRALVVLQTGTIQEPDYFPPYDRAKLRAEMELFRQWYVPHRLRRDLTGPQQEIIDQTFALLEDAALAQPQVWVHRDYHSRNLMQTSSNNPGILDFQDAVNGPVTYDLVSLLRDCYITWPAQQIDEWALGYYHLARQAGIPVGEDEQVFLEWFDLVGIQRHIKVLGIFSRLYHRDGKANFLDDLPRVVTYLQTVSARHPRLTAFHDLLHTLHEEQH